MRIDEYIGRWRSRAHGNQGLGLPIASKNRNTVQISHGSARRVAPRTPSAAMAVCDQTYIGAELIKASRRRMRMIPVLISREDRA